MADHEVAPAEQQVGEQQVHQHVEGEQAPAEAAPAAEGGGEHAGAAAAAPAPQQPEERKERSKGPPDVSNLYSVKIDNIAFETAKEDLERLFEAYGAVRDVSPP
jgi:hypothetical protein